MNHYYSTLRIFLRIFGTKFCETRFRRFVRNALYIIIASIAVVVAEPIRLTQCQIQ